jgi:type IV secretion system protein VirB1
MDPLSFAAVAAACAPMVDLGTARALVDVESGFHRYAIGIVGGRLDRQPRSGAEAIATAQALRAQGWNFSVGLGQINVHNFARLGLTTRSAFEPCANLAALQTILQECFTRASRVAALPQSALRQALSCYYSGDFVTGVRHGYTGRVVRAYRHGLPHLAPRSSKELS